MRESKSDLPLISVVLCTFNGERFLQEQLRSIEEQTYPNLEVIISDDASTDSTKDILNEYEKCLGFKVFYQDENLGYIKNFWPAPGAAPQRPRQMEPSLPYVTKMMYGCRIK